MTRPSGDEPASESGPTEPPRRPKHRKRVTTEPPPGVDPTPTSEPPRHELTENDDRLRAEKPPHY
jgi:hypothetical protein